MLLLVTYDLNLLACPWIQDFIMHTQRLTYNLFYIMQQETYFITVPRQQFAELF